MNKKILFWISAVLSIFGGWERRKEACLEKTCRLYKIRRQTLKGQGVVQSKNSASTKGQEADIFRVLEAGLSEAYQP